MTIPLGSTTGEPHLSHTQQLKPHHNEGLRLGQPGFEWTPAADTDVIRSFKRMGWIPPSMTRHQSIKEAA